MNNWAWLAAPVAAFVVGLMSGAVLLWNNRQRPHDVLKTYVDIYNELPDGETKDRLWSGIEERLQLLTTPRQVKRIGRNREEVPIQAEFRAPLSVHFFAAAALATALMLMCGALYFI